LYYVLAFLNSKLTPMYIDSLNPTITTQVGDLKRIPLLKLSYKDREAIETAAEICVDITKSEWDSYETSWDFKKHPLVMYVNSDSARIEDCYKRWSEFMIEQFNLLKTNQEKINKILIDNYRLQDELAPNIEDTDLSISKPDIVRDIKTLISYAIGCLLGRFSLNEEGLMYGGGEFDLNNYQTIKPVEDNILPIADDVYFEEDIVTRLIDFIRKTFGEGTLEENLDYIAATLNKKHSETSRQAIRRYFLSDFYKDHLQMYKKKPIYWLFDSGKQNGFKALIYMHRYDPYTVARVRTDYLHKLQKKYDAEINRLDIVLESNVSQAEKTKARKKKEDLIKKMQECTVYDQAIAHVANQKIEIDLDDGVAVNYAKFQGVEIPQGEGKKPLKADLLAKI